jgi:hypothetical protein
MKAAQTLRNGGIVWVEGVAFIMDGDGNVTEGDTYIAHRNRDPLLLTARRVDIANGWITPVEPEYPFNIPECVKVRLVDTE